MAWIGVGTTATGLVATFTSWFTGDNDTVKRDKAKVALLAGSWGIQSGSYDYLGLISQLMQSVKNYEVAYLPFVETISKKLASDWSWIEGSGANPTHIYYNNPAGWLHNLMEYNREEYYDGYTYSTAKYLAFILRQSERTASRLNYNGSLVGGSADDYSAARLLARIHNGLYGDITYAETGNGGVRSVVSILGYLANLTYYNGMKLNGIRANTQYQGTLNGSTVEENFTTARLLARLYNLNYQEVTLHETGGTAYRSTAGLLGYIANLTYDTQYSAGTYIETGNSGKRSLADMMLYTANLAHLSKERLNDISGYMVADSKMVSKGFADVLAKLDGLKIEAEVGIDLSGVESRLDTIAGLLLMAGAKDLVDSIVGELDTLKLAALSGQVEAAVQQAFPFCIPAVLKQCLGLVRAEASPPCIEFDVWGAPLVLDFAPYQGFADLSGWACRILFAVGLLIVSPRFVWRGAVPE